MFCGARSCGETVCAGSATFCSTAASADWASSDAVEEVSAETLDTLSQLVQHRRQQGKDLTVIWRTSQFDVKKENRKFYANLNAQVLKHTQTKNYHPSSYIVMDFATAMVSRSFGEQRIHGDSPEHMGLEARLTSIQMLNNIVVQQDPIYVAKQ